MGRRQRGIELPYTALDICKVSQDRPALDFSCTTYPILQHLHTISLTLAPRLYYLTRCRASRSQLTLYHYRTTYPTPQRFETQHWRGYRVRQIVSAKIQRRPTLHRISAAARSMHPSQARSRRLQGKQSCLCEISAATYPIPRPSRKLHRCHPWSGRRDVSGKPQRHDDLPCTRSRTARTKTCAAVREILQRREPPRCPVWRSVHWGNRGEGRLTLSRS